jgi:toxin HigB-1
VIRSFRHAGIEQLFKTGSKAGINSAHAEKLVNRMQVLDFAKSAADMNMPGWGLHKLTGELKGHWAVKVSGNWRLTFAFVKQGAILVDYQDNH